MFVAEATDAATRLLPPRPLPALFDLLREAWRMPIVVRQVWRREENRAVGPLLLAFVPEPGQMLQSFVRAGACSCTYAGDAK